MLNSLAAIYGVGGPATDFESIATVTVGAGGSSSISFSSIPSTYKHLQLRMFKKTGGAVNPAIQFNGDTGSNYAWHLLLGQGSLAQAAAATSQTSYAVTFTSSEWGASVLDILDYSNTNKNKTLRELGGTDLNGSGNIVFNSGLWINTSAISSISITTTSNFVQYSHFALYGIKG